MNTKPAWNRTPVVLGEKWFRWTVLRSIEGSNPRKVMCRCDCGIEKAVNYSNLRRGLTKSCGCLWIEIARSQSTHGETRGHRVSPEYTAWAGMKDRCFRVTSPKFGDYGGRGITVCDRWRDSYEDFLADMGRRPSSKHSLDRIDVNGNYEPNNVRWATDHEQSRNKRNNVMLTVRGEQKVLRDWAAQLGSNRDVVRNESRIRWRLKHGWSSEDAILTPNIPQNRRSFNSEPKGEPCEDQFHKG